MPKRQVRARFRPSPPFLGTFWPFAARPQTKCGLPHLGFLRACWVQWPQPPPFCPQREQWVEHLGYVSLFPLMLRLLAVDAPQLAPMLALIRDPKQLWTPFGIRSLSKADLWAERENAAGDAPYWRGPIWINLNYLILSGLHHYSTQPGPQQDAASVMYAELRTNLVGNMLREWQRTGYFFEQYNPDTGVGQRNHPFNGWSSLALLALAEIY